MRRLKPYGRVSARARELINGRRGAFQLIFALVYFILGISYVILPSTQGRENALGWIGQYIPLRILGLVWLVAAVMAVIGSRTCRPHDRHSFMALAVAPMVWGFLYIGGAVGAGAWVYALTAVLYGALGTAVLIVSGMNGDHDRDERRIVEVSP